MTAKSADTIERRGHCLCGKVNIMAKNASSDVGACHCKMCRRWGGGPFMEIDCGTHLFDRLKESGQHMIPVGVFEDSESLVFKGQVFIDEKPEYYEFANKTKDFTGAEIFAMFGSS